MTTTRPKSLPKARTEGAPPYVLAVHQEPGPGMKDVFMVFFTWPLWQPSMGRRLPYLELRGTSGSWGELSDRTDRQGCGTLISWSDLPPEVQKGVLIGANFPNEIVIVEPSWEANHKGTPCYLLAAAHGYGYYGSAAGYPSLKACRAHCEEKGWILIERRADHEAFLKIHRQRFQKANGLEVDP